MTKPDSDAAIEDCAHAILISFLGMPVSTGRSFVLAWGPIFFYRANQDTNDDRAHDAMQKADTKAREKQERATQLAAPLGPMAEFICEWSIKHATFPFGREPL